MQYGFGCSWELWGGLWDVCGGVVVAWMPWVGRFGTSVCLCDVCVLVLDAVGGPIWDLCGGVVAPSKG